MNRQIFFRVIALLLTTFVPLRTADAADAAVFRELYALRDGKVFRDGRSLDNAELCEVSAGDGPVRFWCAPGSNSHSIPEDETGVFLFDGDGRCVGVLPLESEFECQNLFFSPDGKHLLLERGSGARPDMTFELFEVSSSERLAEFAGVRNQVEWLDSARFVFTRIEEGLRDNGFYYGLGYGLYLSVALVDVATPEARVLKKATDAQNYSLASVSEDGNAVTILEESVLSKQDWDDREKIASREIRMEVPHER